MRTPNKAATFQSEHIALVVPFLGQSSLAGTKGRLQLLFPIGGHPGHRSTGQSRCPRWTPWRRGLDHSESRRARSSRGENSPPRELTAPVAAIFRYDPVYISHITADWLAQSSTQSWIMHSESIQMYRTPMFRVKTMASANVLGSLFHGIRFFKAASVSRVRVRGLCLGSPQQ